MNPPEERKRKHDSWTLYIPCTVEWSGRTVHGILCNLSYAGALIGRVDSMPPDREDLDLAFTIEGREYRLKSRLDFRSVHSGWDLAGEIGIGLFSVRFLKPEEIREELSSIFASLALPGPAEDKE